MDEPHSKLPHVHAVVRIDFPFDEGHPGNCVTVVKVLQSEESAAEEVSRLNAVNSDKNCVYIRCLSRWVGDPKSCI